MVLEEKVKPLVEIINPIELEKSLEEKSAELYSLADNNLQDIEQICTELQQGINCKTETSLKAKESILNKSIRPDTKEKYNWFSVEHLRDSLRFRCTINKLDDVCRIIEYLIKLVNENKLIQSFVKIDTSKFIEAKASGFRCVVVDLRHKSGLLIEFYFTFPEILSEDCHEIFSKWRSKSALTIAQNNLYEELRKDFEISNEILGEAWNNALLRVGLSNGEVEKEWGNIKRTIDSYFPIKEGEPSSCI